MHSILNYTEKFYSVYYSFSPRVLNVSIGIMCDVTRAFVCVYVRPRHWKPKIHSCCSSSLDISFENTHTSSTMRTRSLDFYRLLFIKYKTSNFCLRLYLIDIHRNQIELDDAKTKKIVPNYRIGLRLMLRCRLINWSEEDFFRFVG